MTERWRCFVAGPLGEELRASLADAVGGWRTNPEMGGLRWTDPSSWHLTLAFLGSIEPAAVADARRAIELAAAAHGPFVVRTGGLGAFPSAGRARVLCYGVDRSAALDALVNDLRGALAMDVTEPFRGHVTLARSRREPVDLRSFLSGRETPAGTVAVDRLELLQSHLGGGPARYEVLATAALGVHAGV